MKQLLEEYVLEVVQLRQTVRNLQTIVSVTACDLGALTISHAELEAALPIQIIGTEEGVTLEYLE